MEALFFEKGQKDLYDAAVIGSGPVGSHTAFRLAEVGHRVVVLERKPRLSGKVCCTGIVGRDCMNSFFIEKRVILRNVNGACLFSPSGSCLRLWRPETQAFVIDRAAFDVAMAERMGSIVAEYMLDSRVEDVRVEGDGVKVEADCGGRRVSVRARAAVITAGFGSGLTENLGRVDDFIAGAQAEVETKGVDEIEVYFGQGLAPGFFGWLVPTLPGRALVGLLSRNRPGHHLRELMSSLHAQGKIVATEAEMSHGGIPLKPLTKTYGDRMLVVGDAAGQVKPTTGGGIYYGLLCADMAAGNLHRALETDDLSARSLARYERQWKRKLERELRVGYRARKLYERLSDRQIDRIFDITIDRGIVEGLLKTDDLSFDWHAEALLRLVGHSAVSGFLKVVKLPFPFDR